MTPIAARFLDKPAELAAAAATVLAVVALATGLPALLRDRYAGRARITPALVVLTGGAAITFVAYLAFTLRCGNSGCRKGAGEGWLEADRWWRDDSTWQWGGQLLLAALGLAAAAVAFWLGARGRGGRAPVVAAWALYAVDELSGFIAACALVRPTGIRGMTPKSVKKKLKQPSFAAAVNRDEVQRGAEELGVDFDEHLRTVIAAMEENAAELGLEGEAQATSS